MFLGPFIQKHFVVLVKLNWLKKGFTAFLSCLFQISTLVELLQSYVAFWLSRGLSRAVYLDENILPHGQGSRYAKKAPEKLCWFSVNECLPVLLAATVTISNIAPHSHLYGSAVITPSASFCICALKHFWLRSLRLILYTEGVASSSLTDHSSTSAAPA